jgi:hypothetical protein
MVPEQDQNQNQDQDQDRDQNQDQYQNQDQDQNQNQNQDQDQDQYQNQDQDQNQNQNQDQDQDQDQNQDQNQDQDQDHTFLQEFNFGNNVKVFRSPRPIRLDGPFFSIPQEYSPRTPEQTRPPVLVNQTLRVPRIASVVSLAASDAQFQSPPPERAHSTTTRRKYK